MNELDNQIVLITGAGKGLGSAMAQAFAVQGARVAANDLTPINLDVTVERIVADGGQARAYVADVASKLAVQTMLNRIVDDWGGIDILINNARVQPRDPLLTIDEWDWRRTLDVNLTGAFLLTQSVGRIMRDQGNGVIVNISAARAGIAQASLQGLIGLTQSAAAELAVHQIRVYALIISSQTEYPKALNRALGLCSLTTKIPTGQVVNL